MYNTNQTRKTKKVRIEAYKSKDNLSVEYNSVTENSDSEHS